MDYISKQVKKQLVVWIKDVNRYIVLQQPAFDVFKKLSQNVELNEIANWFSKRHKIAVSESFQFVTEINSKLKELKKNKHSDFPKREKIDFSELIAAKTFKSYNYKIFNTHFQFSYSSPWMKDMIHQGIAHLQTSSAKKDKIQFHLIEEKEELILVVNKNEFFRWPVNQSEFFKGSVSLQLLNAVYNKTDEQWLGAFHASAVTRNSKAVLISASSGSGKSTLSALLAANGLQLISDDLVPISLDHQELYSFPTAISVKPGAIKTLLPHYPELANIQTQLNTSTGKESVNLVPHNANEPVIAKVKAIIFPEYNPKIDFEWEEVDNISVLNDLLIESWISDNENAVKTFLDWYFDIPCFRLRYSNNKKAIEKVSQLLD